MRCFLSDSDSDVCLSGDCLSDVCLSCTSGVTREKTKIGTEVAHVTRDSYTTFKIKRSKVKVTRSLRLSVQVTT